MRDIIHNQGASKIDQPSTSGMQKTYKTTDKSDKNDADKHDQEMKSLSDNQRFLDDLLGGEEEKKKGTPQRRKRVAEGSVVIEGDSDEQGHVLDSILGDDEEISPVKKRPPKRSR